MSNYTKTTDFEAKDSLPTGDSGKIIRGAEFETEFDAISTAIATKADTAGPTFTGTLTFETISDGTIGVTAFVDEDDMVSNSATLVPTQQSVKAYVDAVTTELQAQDLDFQADSGGALSIDLDTETMTFTGGTGITTTGLANDVTFAIDSTVATLTGTQTLTNKTLTSPDVNTPDIDGGTIDGATIATSDITVGTGKTLDVSSGTLTLANDQISGDKVEGGTIASTTITSLASTTVDTTNLEVTNIKAKDGTAAGSIADTTGVVTLASSVLTTTDINGGTIDGATIGGTTAAAGSFTTVSATGNITVDGTVDGRDIATDGTKLDGIEALADVTDTTNVTAAGALMDSELTNETAVKALNQGVATTDSPTFAGLTTTADVSFGDNDKAVFGAGNDLEILSNGTDGFIRNGNATGEIRIESDDRIVICDRAFNESFAIFNDDDDVKLFHNGSEKFATTSTGIDVTGTVTADGLNLDGNIQGDTGQNMQVSAGAGAGDKLDLRAGDDVRIYVNGATAHKLSANFANNNDISFYEDTGTTAKLFWDASAESLGIGTSSPSTSLMLEHNNDGAVGGTIRIKDRDSQQDANQLTGAIEFESEDATTPTSGVSTAIKAFAASSTGGSYLTISTTDISTSTLDERMRIDSSGRVGINRTPSISNSKLEVSGADNVPLINVEASGNTGGIGIGSTGFQFFHGSTARMRIDASGNLLVNTTDTNPTTGTGEGIVLGAGGIMLASNTSDAAIALNRTSTDGDIAIFKKNGTPIGSIGTSGGRLYIGSDDTSIFFDSGTSPSIRPHGPADPDGVIDIGESGYRFKDLYLSGGVYLGGTGSANLLDDYEEGTWTPTINSGTMTASEATYTKIGNLVTVRANIGDISDNTTATDIEIGGLPFTAKSTNRGAGTTLFRYFSKTDAAQMNAYVHQNASEIDLYWSFNADTAWTKVQFADGTRTNMDVILTVSYITS